MKLPFPYNTNRRYKKMNEPKKYNRIRDLREDCDKTQHELADYLGTSPQHYGKYELGNAEIPFDRAIKLANYYNVSLDYIAGLTNVKKGLTASEIDSSLLELIQFINRLSDTERAAVKETLRLVINAL